MAFARSGGGGGSAPAATGSTRGTIRLNGDLDPNSTPDYPMLAAGIKAQLNASIDRARADFEGNTIDNWRHDMNVITAGTYTLAETDTGAIVVCTNLDGTVITVPLGTLGLGSECEVVRLGGPVVFVPQDSTVNILEVNGYSRSAGPGSVINVRWVPGIGSANVVLSGDTAPDPADGSGDGGTTTPPPAATLLLDTPGLRQMDWARGWSRLRASYTGYAFRAYLFDGTYKDIGFMTDGSPNIEALTQFALAASDPEGDTSVEVRAGIIYDQSGSGRDLVQATYSHMPLCFSGHAPCTDAAGNYAFVAADTACGIMTAEFTPFTGNSLTGVVVGQMVGTSTTVAPRVLSFYGTTNTDGSDNQGVDLIARDGGASPTQAIQLFRNGVKRSSKAITYATTQQWVGRVSGGTYHSEVEGAGGTDGSTTAANFAFRHNAWGYTGSAYSSVQDQMWIEDVGCFAALTNTELDLIEANQASRIVGIASPATTVTPQGLTRTLVYQEDYSTNPLSHFYVQDNGKSTKYLTNAWMASQVSYDATNKHIVMTYHKGASQRIGGNIIWKGAGNAAVALSGYWEYEIKLPPDSKGMGEVDLLWCPSKPWPTGGEPDIKEIYASNGNKYGGESNFHYSTTVGSNSAVKCPTTSADYAVPADVTAGTYQIDHTQWHTIGCAWVPGGFVAVYYDGVFKGMSNSKVPAAPNAAMELHHQQEFYGVTEDNAVAADREVRIRAHRYYSLA